jgi:hypothetical protein
LGASSFMIPRIYADENDKTTGDRYMLDIAGSLRDIERHKGELSPGMRVVFNVQDEFEVEGVLEYDPKHKIWLGQPDYSTRRDI